MTARASSFRLHTSDTELADVGRLLRVRYCLSGTIEVSDQVVVVSVELVETADGGIVWADRFSARLDDVHAMRELIRLRVLTALEIQIPIREAALARLGAAENLDAWSAYHLGMQHMYRFNRVDNAAAAALFQRAVALDPYFARAHAGLSFIHFQTAFMGYTARHCPRDQARTAVRGARDGTRSTRPVRQLHDGAHLLARRRPG